MWIWIYLDCGHLLLSLIFVVVTQNDAIVTKLNHQPNL